MNQGLLYRCPGADDAQTGGYVEGEQTVWR